MDTVKVKVINKSHHQLPAYSTPGSAGMDLRAFLPQGPVVIKAGQRALIPTGIYMQLPVGYECQIRPRSGLALNHGLTVANAPGTIDSDYRGEICAILINLGENDFIVKDGERICQMIVTKYDRVQWVPSESLDRTEREDGGFGHTGLS